MLDRSNIRALASGAALFASLAGLASCGGISEGDYVVYRVAFEEAKKDPGCYADDSIPIAQQYDSKTFQSGQTLILYVASGDSAMLDIGGLVLQGSIDDDPYRFSGDDENIEFPFSDMAVDSDRDGIADLNDPFVDADGDGDEDDDVKTDAKVDTDGDDRDDREEDSFVDADADGKEDRFVQIVSDTKVISRDHLDIEMTVDGSTLVGFTKRTTETTCEGVLCPPHVDLPCIAEQRFTGVEIEEADLSIGGRETADP